MFLHKKGDKRTKLFWLKLILRLKLDMIDFSPPFLCKNKLDAQRKRIQKKEEIDHQLLVLDPFVINKLKKITIMTIS